MLREEAIVATRVRITGRVQRVGYRYWAEGWARRLGLAGYVRNLTDGSVDAVFAGSAHAVARMLMLCEEGSQTAQVAAVDSERAPEGWTADAVAARGGPQSVGFRRAPTVEPTAPPPLINSSARRARL